MMVRCEENILNIDVFLKSQIFCFFDNLWVLGTARELILAAFWVLGAAFWWSGRVLGRYCNIAALARLPGGGPKREITRSGGAKPRFLGLPTNLQPVLQDYRTTGLQDYRTADLN